MSDEPSAKLELGEAKREMLRRLQGEMAELQARRRRRRQLVRAAGIAGVALVAIVLWGVFGRDGGRLVDSSVPYVADAEDSAVPSADQRVEAPVGQALPSRPPEIDIQWVDNRAIERLARDRVNVEQLSDEQLVQLMGELGQPGVVAKIGGEKVFLAGSR